MDFVLTLDNGYCQHAAVVMASICLNNIGKHRFYVISDCINYLNKRKFSSLSDLLKCDINFIFIEKEKFDDFPIGNKTANNYVTLATYYRLLLVDLLPKDLERIIYLDCDIVVNGSLDSLWNWRFSENAMIAALEDQKGMMERCVILGFPVKYSYFNAGVILFDLKKVRAIYSIQDVLAYIRNNYSKIKFHDQDILNVFFYDKKDFISLRFNVMDTFLKRQKSLPARYEKEYADLYNPVIVHYSGPIKPWFVECNHPYKVLYYYYLSKTPWSDYVPKSRYDNIVLRLLYRLKYWIKEALSIIVGKSERYKKEFYQIYTCCNLTK